jgi:hypothetical protein
MDHPYSLAYALYHSGFLHLWRREPEMVRARAERLLELVKDHDFPLWRALGTCLLGAATTALGSFDEGLARINEGFDQYTGLRTPPVFWPLVRFTQAGAYADAGDATVGLRLIDEAAAIAGPDEVLAPLFYVLRGDLLLLDPGANVGQAEVAYQEAFDRATRSRSQSPRLRAAIRLVRAAAPEQREARLAVLRDTYSSFNEGFDTPDLREATELLESAR